MGMRTSEVTCGESLLAASVGGLQAHGTLLPKGFTCSVSLQGPVIECACKCVNMQRTIMTVCLSRLEGKK